MGASENALLTLVDQKTRLAGSNRMELLLFSLGGKETFGINVFKVREVCETPEITRTPNMPIGVEGIISLRGSIIPVIDLARVMGSALDGAAGKLVITEFSSHTQAFHVADVDRIVRVDWESVRTPQGMLAVGGHLVTALTELPDGKLVSILDVEQILHDTFGDEPTALIEAVEPRLARMVFFADDSAFARRKISEVLEQMQLPSQFAINGREAWARLDAMASRAVQEQKPLSASLGLVLLDAEMPEMDGYVLTQHVKSDVRFAGIPVVMHSSLSSMANRKMGQQVGVDHYVAKFNAESLASTIAGILHARQEH
jgi:two-component system, chemotaxis family, chemotaxis protein CheV